VERRYASVIARHVCHEPTIVFRGNREAPIKLAYAIEEVCVGGTLSSMSRRHLAHARHETQSTLAQHL
jgi:hypothetical protein